MQYPHHADGGRAEQIRRKMQYSRLLGSNVGFVKIIAYGQNVENRDLPVKQDVRLRAKRGKLGFARKTRRAVTGKTRKTEICP